MNQKRQFISDQYHFLGEMIIISILMILPIHFYYAWIPMWSLPLVTFPLCLLFTLLEKKGVDYKSYYLIVPLLVIAFLVFQFPILLIVPFSVFIIWRYLRIRQHLLRGHEARTILLTAMLSIVVYIITNEFLAIGYLLLQLFVLVFGFMSSHAAVMDKKKRTLEIYKAGFHFVIFLAIGGLIAFWFGTQSYIARAFDVIIYFIFSILGRVLYLFGFLKPSDFEKLIDGLKGMAKQPTLVEFQGINFIGSVMGMYVAIGLLIAVFGIFVLLNILKKDASPQEGIDGKLVNLGVAAGEYDVYEKIIRNFKRRRIGKKHPVRIMVHQFERKAKKSEIGRKQSETISEWFERIGLQVNVEVYQKVRYGDMDVQSQEIEVLKIGLEGIISSLSKKNKS